MSEVDKVTVGVAEIGWDADSRVAILRFTRESHVTGKDALVLVEALTRWIGTEGETFGLLGDGGKLSGVDAEYRSVWGAFLKQHRRECFVAFYNMNPVIRIAAEMFRIGTGVQLKAFAEETDARSWLRHNGIPA